MEKENIWSVEEEKEENILEKENVWSGEEGKEENISEKEKILQKGGLTRGRESKALMQNVLTKLTMFCILLSTEPFIRQGWSPRHHLFAI